MLLLHVVTLHKTNPPSAGFCVSMTNEIEIVLKNRQYSNAVIMALLPAGFELLGKDYMHDGLHLRLKVPYVAPPSA